MKDQKILFGQKFGKWTVIGDGYKTDYNHSRMLCRCECGNTHLVRVYYLKKGRSKGCRKCAGQKGDISAVYKHGLRCHKLYRVWSTMKDRCYREKSTKYHCYGGRGIKVCDEWKNDFKIFYDWCMKNGWKEGLQIDRINNNKSYFPENCRFVNTLTNSRNSSNAKLTIADIIEIKKLKKEGFSHQQLAIKFNVARGTIGTLNNMDLSNFTKL